MEPDPSSAEQLAEGHDEADNSQWALGHHVPSQFRKFLCFGKDSDTPSPLAELRTEHPNAFKGMTCLLVFLVLVTAVTLISVSLKRLESDEYGVPYDAWARELDEEVEEEGLHNGPPGFEFIKFKSTYSTIEIPKDLNLESYHCVSKDGLTVNLEISFQYLPNKKYLYDIVQLYRDAGRYKDVVVSAGLSAINHGCGDFNIGSFQGERALVQERMFQYLKLKLEGTAGVVESNVSLAYQSQERGLYAIAIDLALSSLSIPPRYQSAVEAKQSAEEDIQLAGNQRVGLVTDASKHLASAETAANVIRLEAHEQSTVIVKNAEFRANATKLEFEKEAETYKAVMESLSLSNEGFLAYLGTRMVENTGDAKIALTEPAIASYRDEL